MNNTKTHPLNLKNKKISRVTGDDYSNQKQVCSELNAVLKLKRLTNIDSRKCTLVNIRYDRNDKISMARPCMSCQSLLKYFNFKKIYYTDSDGKYINY